MTHRAHPVRTCVGCRTRAPAAELLRVVAVEHYAGYRLVADPTRLRPGRGAHLHPDPACLAKAERRRAFGRALRLSGAVDDGPVRAHIGQHAATTGHTTSGGANPGIAGDSKVGRPT
ncbi:MAG TPA: YlxR family protein [Micromonosporaceae bacterium]